MGFDKHRREDVFAKPPRVLHDTSSDEEVMPYWIAIDATATDASSFSFTLKEDVRVIDALTIDDDGTSGTVTVNDADSNAITDAISLSGSSGNVVRAGSVDPSNWDEDEDNDLNVVQDSNSDACYVYVQVIPR